MKTYVGVDVLTHIFLTLALVEGGHLHATAALLPIGRRLGEPHSWSGRH
jgi:hypothetical protein